VKANVAEFSVSELAQAIKRALEGGFGHIRLRGEVSGYRGPHSSGHCYFSLKDESARIDAVIWRGVFGSLRFKPSEGLEVIAIGKITTYPGSSKYQIVIETLEPAGVGALMALLEERKKQLTAEGLFATERKRPLPFLPRVVGIVTSPTGAVIRDMLHGFAERFPVHVIVWPVRVQGETSAAEVAAAIRGFNALTPGGPIPRPDVLIVARGGGSLEDLWSFNEEIVVRAAAESTIPLIAAVGHETDWTLIDLVADARAPTPTKAAEWAVPKRSDLLQQIAELNLRLGTGMRRTIAGERTRLRAIAGGLPRAQDLVAMPRQRYDSAAARLARALQMNSQVHANRFGRIASRLSESLVRARLQRAGDQLERISGLSDRAARRRLEAARARLDRVRGLLRPQAILQQQQRGSQRLFELGERLGLAARNQIERRERALNAVSQLLSSLSHRSVLERGFAIVRGGEGQMLRAVAQVVSDAVLDIEFADGHVAARATGGTAGLGPSRAPGVRPPVAAKQGSLF
jgi:exodeoxyribonuclease VII large subunit